MWNGGPRARSRGGNPPGNHGPGVDRSATFMWQRARGVFGVVLVLLAVSLIGLSSGQVRRAQAPAFTLALLDGTTLRLADMKGSPIVLLFWAPW